VRPGPILDEHGAVVGAHAGVHGFTLGQRKSLGVALGRRAYVVGIDAEKGAVRLGDRAELAVARAELGETTLAPDVTAPFECDVLVRYRGSGYAARVEACQGGLAVEFHAPVLAVVPGQFAVFVRAERVLGGGVIQRTTPAAVERSVSSPPPTEV